MNCDEAARLLTKLLSNVGPDAQLSLDSRETEGLQELVAKGHVERVSAGALDETKLARLKKDLTEIQRRELGLRESITEREVTRGRSYTDRDRDLLALERIEADERTLRTQILGLVETAARVDGSVGIGGTRYAVSYRGKELLTTLNPRLRRMWAMSLGDFEASLATVRQAFDARADKAYRLLRRISPALPGIDEIHCRAAAVGLSVREEPPSAVAFAYVRSVQLLMAWPRGIALPLPPSSQRRKPAKERWPQVAEGLCVTSGTLDPGEIRAAVGGFLDLWRRVSDAAWVPEDDAVRATLMLLAYPPAAREEMIGRALALSREAADLSRGFKGNLPAALLIVGAGRADEPGRRSAYVEYGNALQGLGVTGSEGAFASAILAVAGGPDIPAAVDRMRIAWEYLARFSEDGMAVPAAMLASQSPDVEEALDNLRLASAAISAHKLSLGGMENLSLGMKLLMQTAVVPGPASSIAASTEELAERGEPRLGAIGLIGVAVAAPILLPAFYAFHESALHRLAVSDYSFHPVHTHYVYG